MSTLKEDLLPVVDELRSIAGELGFRPFTVELVRKSSGNWKLGVPESLEIITSIQTIDGYAPKVRWMEQKDYARGMPLDVALEVGPITPAYNDGSAIGGYTYEELEDSYADPGSQIFYRIFGPGMPDSGGTFAKTSFSGNRALGFFIQLKRVAD